MSLSLGLTPARLDRWAHTFLPAPAPLTLAPEAREAITRSFRYLSDRLAGARDTALYGINTGFGYLCDKVIRAEDLKTLQLNLIRSHACGAGAEVPRELVRLMLALKVQSLAYGHSGVHPDTVERLIACYHADLIPVVYEQGSLGASGDLAPLAHLSLPLIGEGEVWLRGERMPAGRALQALGWAPLELHPKEGLALLNGTQFMLAYGVYLLLHGKALWHLANRIAALSLDGFACKSEPFHPLLHEIRPHQGQVKTAASVRELLLDSEITHQPRTQVQDPYSFRCIPQVHGASYDLMTWVQQVLETETASVSDNPNIFPDEDLILSGGNFHGQPLALALDSLALALAELGSISGRRTYQLLSGVRGLPLFLAPDPGLHSGLMIPQYTAAGIVSQNKQLCTPASVDTIPSSNNQEDHVSMGANAATKCYRILQNLRQILGIELIAASQALYLREPLRTGRNLQTWVHAFREMVPPLTADRILHPDMVRARDFLQQEAEEMLRINAESSD
ncbi:MAG: histidine ammonia-lyase [Bacteroidia bacterium]|nr:histidine ammonia-lyase [Bacteroidia bacterium]